MLFDLYTQGTVARIEGPLLFLHHNVTVGLNEAVEVTGPGGTPRLGRIMTVDEDRIVVELLEGTAGLDTGTARVRFRGEPMTMALGPGLLGRVFDGVGRPRDDGPPVAAVVRRRVDTGSINPAFRAVPNSSSKPASARST